MTRLTREQYLDAIARETAQLREVVVASAPGTRVPTCPDWDTDDLLWHLGGEVQDFWAHVVEVRPAPPADHDEPDRPAGRDALLAAVDGQHARFMTALRTADPGEAAWSWSGEEDQTVGFTDRRQAHEALIHRVDAELAAGARTPLDPPLAADGVLECLDVMFGGTPPWGAFAPDGAVVAVDLTDTGDRVLVALGRFTGTDPEGETHDEDDLEVVGVGGPGEAPGEGEVVATLSGTAEAMDLWLWRRADDRAITASGDPAVLDRLRALVGRPIT